MVELVEFLKDRYDEEAAVARAAIDVVGPILGAGRWRYTKSNADEGGRYWSITTTAPDSTVPMPTVELVGSGMSGGGVHEEAVAEHIVRHDPVRVLREVEAKRRLLDEHKPDRPKGRPNMERHCLTCTTAQGWDETASEANCLTLRLLALPYADRPGYREDWRP